MLKVVHAYITADAIHASARNVCKICDSATQDFLLKKIM